MTQKVFPPPTVGVPSASKSLSAFSARLDKPPTCSQDAEAQSPATGCSGTLVRRRSRWHVWH